MLSAAMMTSCTADSVAAPTPQQNINADDTGGQQGILPPPPPKPGSGR